MRESLDRHLNTLKNEILLLDSMVEQAILNSVDALKRRDIKLARTVAEDDQAINDKRYAIENAILTLIATQQPIAAGDLRLVTAMLEIISELERIGDYAKGISHVVEHIGDSPIVIPIKEITRMSDLAVSMLHRSLSAFVNANEIQARRIPLEDAEVNELYNLAYRQLVKGMVKSPEMIDRSNQVMWTLHNLERMADRVSNICERTIFVVTGQLLELDSEAGRNIELDGNTND